MYASIKLDDMNSFRYYIAVLWLNYFTVKSLMIVFMFSFLYLYHLHSLHVFFSFFLSAGCSQQRCLVSHACGQPRSCSCLCADGNRGPTQESWRRKKEVGTWITCFLTALYFFPSFFKLSFTKYFLKCPWALERISTLENGWLFLSSMPVHLLNASVGLQLLSAHCRWRKG